MWLAVHTQQQNPHRILTLLLQHGSVLEIGQKFRDRINQSKHHYFPTSPQSQKPLKLPQDNMQSSQDKTHSISNSKSLETSCMSYHTTTPKILNTLILSLVLVPTKTHAITLDLFLTFLAQRKSSCQDSSHSVFLIKFQFYLFTTPQNQNQTTRFFKSSFQVQSLSFSFITTQPPAFTSSLFHLFASPKSPYQSPSKNLIHRCPETFSLGYRDCIPSQQLTPFVMTCKTTKTHKKIET